MLREYYGQLHANKSDNLDKEISRKTPPKMLKNKIKKKIKTYE